MGKTLMMVGALLLVVGVGIHLGSKFLPFGSLPGDIKIQKENFSFYFPIMSCIVISVVLSVVLSFIKHR